MADARLAIAARTTLERLGVRTGESVLVLFNPELADIAGALAGAAREFGCGLRQLEFPATTRNGEEPPAEVAAALLMVDAAAIVTNFSLSHTRARAAATRRGVRIASMPGITLDIFCRTVPVDYALLETRGRVLAERLSAADRCRVVSSTGTDIELVLTGRVGRSDDGDLRSAGAFGNLPAGEAYIAPREDRGEGTVIFDGSIATTGLLGGPLRVELRRGRLVSADGEGAEALLTALDAGGKNGRVIAELGIGTNPFARIHGRVIEDEKVEGTIHVAFGTNSGIGGENEAAVHVDGVVRDPTVELDGETILRDGRFV